MKQKQLQLLITAGVFSAALLSGAAYADDSGATAAPAPSQQAPSKDPPPAVQPAPSGNDSATQADSNPSNQPDAKQTAKTDKDPAQHGCGGAAGCSGK